MSHEIHVQARGGLIDPNFDSINTNTGIGIRAILMQLDRYFVSILIVQYKLC